MNYEKSCGCIIIEDGQVLLIKQNSGDWGFPKGHVEENETEVETAMREVKEETNLDVEVQEDKRYEIQYNVKENTLKTAVYFVARKVGGQLQKQESEIDTVKWFSFEKANETLTYNNTRELFKQVLQQYEQLLNN